MISPVCSTLTPPLRMIRIRGLSCLHPTQNQRSLPGEASRSRAQRLRTQTQSAAHCSTWEAGPSQHLQQCSSKPRKRWRGHTIASRVSRAAKRVEIRSLVTSSLHLWHDLQSQSLGANYCYIVILDSANVQRIHTRFRNLIEPLQVYRHGEHLPGRVRNYD